MIEIYLGGTILGLLIIAFGTIYHLIDKLTQTANTTQTNTAQTIDSLYSAKRTFFLMVKGWNVIKRVINSLDQRLNTLETEIRLQKSDSSRLIEWLDKERELRDTEREEFLKAMRITERESQIIEISKNLKLIREKIK